MKIPEKLKKAIGKVEKALIELENIEVEQGKKIFGVDISNCRLYIHFRENSDEGAVYDGVEANWQAEGFLMTLKKKVV